MRVGPFIIVRRYNYEKLPKVSEAMVTLAMIRLMLHRLAHPSRKRSLAVA